MNKKTNFETAQTNHESQYFNSSSQRNQVFINNSFNQTSLPSLKNKTDGRNLKSLPPTNQIKDFSLMMIENHQKNQNPQNQDQVHGQNLVCQIQAIIEQTNDQEDQRQILKSKIFQLQQRLNDVEEQLKLSKARERKLSINNKQLTDMLVSASQHSQKNNIDFVQKVESLVLLRLNQSVRMNKQYFQQKNSSKTILPIDYHEKRLKTESSNNKPYNQYKNHQLISSSSNTKMRQPKQFTVSKLRGNKGGIRGEISNQQQYQHPRNKLNSKLQNMSSRQFCDFSRSNISSISSKSNQGRWPSTDKQNNSRISNNSNKADQFQRKNELNKRSNSRISGQKQKNQHDKLPSTISTMSNVNSQNMQIFSKLNDKLARKMRI